MPIPTQSSFEQKLAGVKLLFKLKFWSGLDATENADNGVGSFVDQDGAHWVKHAVPTPTIPPIDTEMADVKLLFEERLGSEARDWHGTSHKPDAEKVRAAMNVLCTAYAHTLHGPVPLGG